MKTPCTQIHEQLVDLLLDNLDKSQNQTVRHHLDSCSVCQSYFVQLRNQEKELEHMGTHITNNLEEKQEKVIKAMNALPPQAAQPDRTIWSIIMHSKITKPLAAAIIIIAVLTGIYHFTGSIDGASKAYAAAFDSIRQAQTFSCREIFEIKREGVGRCIMEQEWTFKEPGLERHVYISGVDDQFIGETTITDYNNRQELRLNPVNKVARFHDKSDSYEIDPQTGRLRLTQLDTSLRDELLQMRIKAVKDLGAVEIDGRRLRMLQSQKGDRVTTVWVDSQSGLPVEIEIKWLEQKRYPVLYTSIKIDEPLDDTLFSLEPPESYKLEQIDDGWPIYKKKICTKIMYLMKECFVFSAQNNNRLPNTLEELEDVGISNKILQVIMAMPDQEDGLPAIRYRQPRSNKEGATEIMMYEIYDQWPEDGIVVGFTDCHCELIKDQQIFESFLK